ncbi:MAG: DUF5103 domain-containing protein [Bacteroidetes bacterium]|nr:DUF5103 domain-containing protein [Bacteroidota bacterium]
MHIRKLVTAVSLLFSAGMIYMSALPQSRVISNTVYDSRVKTVLLHSESWNLSGPVLEMDSGQKLMLSFDLLGTTAENLWYSFIHCNKDWEPSGLFVSDFIDGFDENQIETYTRSFNTTVKYVHYVLSFPNENIRFNISGNYIILIHKPGEPGQPLLACRFMVTEKLAAVKASVRRADMGEFRETHQQLEVSVSISGARVADPRNEIFTSVLQNGRWDNAKTNLKADFVTPSELRYTSLGTGNLFYGGNEFRQFDIRSFRYQSEFVRDVTYDGSINHINLTPSENREFKPYFYRPDFNGKYVVGVQEGVNPSIDADYAMVYFTLPATLKIEGGNIHIAGEFTRWTPLPENLMRYNYETRQYEGALMLKQGWYNYEYLFVPGGQAVNERRWFEGSHYETENEYLVLVYYRARNSRYDRLIGTVLVRTQAG